MMEKPFDYTEWSDYRLEQGLKALQENQATVPHGPERAALIGRQIVHMAFEMSLRRVELNAE